MWMKSKNTNINRMNHPYNYIFIIREVKENVTEKMTDFKKIKRKKFERDFP